LRERIRVRHADNAVQQGRYRLKWETLRRRERKREMKPTAIGEQLGHTGRRKDIDPSGGGGGWKKGSMEKKIRQGTHCTGSRRPLGAKGMAPDTARWRKPKV